MALLFGDGWTGGGVRQTFAAYCDEHGKLVKRVFVTCDERPVQAASSR